MGRFWFFIALAAASGAAFGADAYKCVGHDGKVSFASMPCPPELGVSTWQARTQRTQLHSLVAQDASPYEINKRATQIMRKSYHTPTHYEVKIVPGEGAKAP